MNILGNLIWVIFGGLIMAVEYIISGAVMCLTIIGIPFGLQVMQLGLFALWPFGGEVVSTPEATGCLSTLLNVIWIFIGGIWIALSHLALGVFFCITIIGIPFGLQHFKLMSYALVPFGRSAPIALQIKPTQKEDTSCRDILFCHLRQTSSVTHFRATPLSPVPRQ